MQWYYAVNGQQQGPVEQEALVALAREGKLGRDDLVWNAGMGNQWAKASTVPGLFETGAPVPGTPPPVATWSDTASFASRTPNRDLMAQAREALAGQWGLAVGGVLIYAIVQVVIALIPVVGGVIGFVVGGALTLGWYLFFITLSRRQPAGVGLLFDGFKRFGTAFVAALLIMLLILAWMLPGLVILGVALFMGFKAAFSGGPGSAAPAVLALLIPLAALVWIPAIVAQLRYAMTYFIINDRPEIGALDAIRQSKQMMNGNKWKCFCLGLRFIGWALLCLPTFGIGFLWLMPYMMTSMGRFYDDLVQER